MNTEIDPHQLEIIKALTLAAAGIKNVTPADCRLLSFLIMTKTKLGVSETTLKRLYGFAISKFNPSYYTLNTLAVYCEFDGWDSFSRIQPKSLPVSDILPADIFDNPLVLTLLDTSIPTAILKANAPDFTIVTYNTAYEDATFIKKRNIRGLALWDAFDPGKAGGTGPTLLLEAIYEALSSKQTVQMPPLHYNVPSAVRNINELSWWNVKIVPVIYEGFVKYLLLNTYNITHKVLHQDAIETAIMMELTMAEDLATTNVKLNKAIENLAENHNELTDTKNKLEELNAHLEERVLERTKRLFENESKQRELINSAPVAIAILKGAEHIIEIANKKILEYWAKDNNVIGKSLAAALPELEGQPFIEILDNVRETGIPYINPELRAFIVYDGIFQARYYDMIYQPIQHSPGITDSIYIVAIDITENVIAKKKLEESESMLRLAITAAKIGIWSYHPKTQVLIHNSIFAKILGWDSEETLTYEQAIGQVTEEFRETLRDVVESAIADGGDYDFTYRHKKFNDGRIIWLRGTGKITTDDAGERCFSGIVRDITHELANFIHQEDRFDKSHN
ncbi:PAS domain-containing protein [Mucilaginibacter aquaedulcis]|uniref:PAS domain-containing protein n=1 Tax=Mucilaginibacter aquaedulcis TaxID=1187081 RepID=UPI0025B43B67|nr:PAS domain-containing protein [Mucilaginibacter aquaedulcis]MDN3548187.1 PAS domain-containing protein [Mucilaginibacter aquaedulcis]